MEIRNGFIVGIYNYCDSWCDRCAFTSHCRVFADLRETEAMLDPNLAPVVSAPEHPSDTQPPPPQWLQQLLREINDCSSEALAGDAPGLRMAGVVPDRDAIDRRADAYSRRARNWLNARAWDQSSADVDPRSEIAWFHMMIHVKAMRALHGLAGDDPSDREWAADHDGSAKVALIGIDRSYAAWLDLVEVGVASPSDVTPFLDDLVWLKAALERTFPKARAFVRPAFDEPEEVARLLRKCRSLDA